MREPRAGRARRPLPRPPLIGQNRLMSISTRKAEDAERICFVSPAGTSSLYDEVAALEGLPADAWIRATLHREAARALERHGRDTASMPPAHLRRPPRLQPRMKLDDDGDGGPR